MNMDAFRKLSLLEKIKSLFLSGLFTILPLAITLAIFTFIIKTIEAWLHPLYYILPGFLSKIPGSDLIVALLAFLAIGFILRFFLMQPLLDTLEGIFEKIPLVRSIYFGIKQLVHALNPKDTAHFQRVVLVEFPRAGVYSVGFLTGEMESGLARAELKQQTPYLNVFIPHTPHLVTGFYIIVPAHECYSTSLTYQEAMTIVISGGIVQPTRFTRPIDAQTPPEPSPE
jgi:uncharacterized membrane protein